MTQHVSTAALNAIDNLTNAADAFVRALQEAADQDTDHRGYWAGYIAQIKHVVEHGGASLEAVQAEVLPAPEGSANRARMNALVDAQEALKTAARLTYRSSVVFGRDDERLTS